MAVVLVTWMVELSVMEKEMALLDLDAGGNDRALPTWMVVKGMAGGDS